MNEIICANCGVPFLPTPSQWRRRKSRPIACCSKACAVAKVAKQLKKELLVKICEYCGKEFQTRTDKYNSQRKYCGMACYTASDQYKKMLEENREKIIKRPDKPYGREVRTCLECGKEFSDICSKKKKYCSPHCFREYRAKRFDRWLANPGVFKLEQGYDEFFANDTSELQCFIDGCDWKGSHLALHLNIAHGIPADEAKRAAGFNLGTGLISIDLAVVLGQRPQVLETIANPHPIPAGVNPPGRYKSKEGGEHRKKARALRSVDSTKKNKKCQYCGQDFHVTASNANLMYCSTKCRSSYYRLKQGGEVKCAVCGNNFTGKSDQYRRFQKGLDVCCSLHCRQKRAGQIAKGTWGGLTTDRGTEENHGRS